MYHVLFVDDEPYIGEMTRLFLEESKEFKVDAKESALDALEVLKARHYDVIVSDYQMPRMDGIAFLKKIRSEGFDTPFIIFTGRGREDVVIEALNSGADYYLQKGGDPEAQFTELRSKIRLAISRRYAEERIESLVRINSLISHVNKNIVRIKNRDELFRTICDIAIEYGKFRMAWIGLIDPKSRDLRPVASCGFGAGEYLENIRISVEDIPEGRGPSGRSAREGRPCVANDIPQDPEMEPWRKQAARFGYLSSGGFPLRCKGRIIGTLSLYAGESDFFSEEEITLLEEVVADISYSLDKLELEKDHASAVEELRKSEEKYRSILENIQDVYFRLDKDARLELISPSGADLLGYPGRGEMLGKPASHFFADAAVADTYLSLLRRDGYVIEMEVTLQRRDGTKVLVSGNSHILFDSEGNYAGAEGIFRDITERKAAEIALRKARDELEEKVRERTQELNTANSQLQDEIRLVREIDAALQESEKRFRLLMEKAPESILIYDVDQDKFIDANEKAEELFGRNRNLLINFGPAQFFTGEQPDGRPVRETIPEHVREALEGKEPVFERRLPHPDGEERMVEVRLVSLPSTKHRLIRCSYIDITERKKAEKALRESEKALRTKNTDLESAYEEIRSIDEELQQNLAELTKSQIALRESEEQFRTLVGNLNVGVFRNTVDGNGSWIWVNTAFLHIFGYDTLGEFLETPVTGIYYSLEDRQSILNALKRDGFVRNFLIRAKKRDGSQVWAVMNAQARQNPDGSIIWVDGICEDITERKQIEEALRESEDRYRAVLERNYQSILDSIHDVFYRLGPDQNLVMVSPSGPELFGYATADEMLGRPGQSFFLENREAEGFFTEILENGSVTEREAALKRKDGSRVIVSGSSHVIYDESGNFAGIEGVFRDITKRREAEDALRKSEEKSRNLAAIVESSDDAIIGKTLEGIITSWNRGAEKVYGYYESEVIGKSIDILVPPDRTGELSEIFKKIRSGEHVDRFETTRVRKDGKIISVSLTVSPILDTRGTIIGASTIARDISAKKQAEEEIRFANMLLSTEQDSSLDGILIIGNDGKVLSYNKRFKSLWKFPDEALSTSDDDLLASVIDNILDPEQFLTKVRYLYDHPEEKSRDEVFLKDGRIFERYSVPLQGSDNQYFGRIWYFHEITEQRQMEQEIRESEEKYRTVIENANEAVVIIQDGNVAFGNPSAYSILGIAPEDFIGKPFLEIIWPEDRDLVGDRYRKRMVGEDVPARYEFRVIGREGKMLWVTLSTAMILWQEKPATLNLLTDITERRMADAERERVAQQRQLALSAARLGWWHYNPITKISSFDERYREIFGVEGNECPNEEILVCLDKEDLPRVWSAVEAALDPVNPQPYMSEYRVYRPDGTMRWVKAYGLAEFEGDGENRHAVSFVGTVEDITERVNSETRLREFNEKLEAQVAERTDQLNKSLGEKEILLREIHHRVKNNLQIIISLIRLQKSRIPDSLAREAFVDSESRIRSMALVHEKLYRSKDLGTIPMNDYIRALSTNLLTLYSLSPGKVQITIEMQDLVFDINTAIPVGLIMNELITNAFKHAFPEGRTGKIEISGFQEDSAITISVADTGVGIPPDLNLEECTSLGFHLVQTLTQQIHGNLNISSEPGQGTKFTITFPKSAMKGV